MKKIVKFIILLFLLLNIISCSEKNQINEKKEEIIENKKLKIDTKNKKIIEKEKEKNIQEKIIKLNEKLEETSGLLFFNKKLWSFNDSSWNPELYEIDKNSGKILQTKKIIWAKNIDWEDICQSEKYIFVWDIGNNKGKRKKWQIYKINKKDFLKDKNFVKTEKVEFFYPPIPNPFPQREKGNKKNNFLEKINFSKNDMEAMIFFEWNIYFFSKWWKDFNVKIYKLDLNKKIKKLKKVWEKNLWWLITGATVYENKIILVWYKDFLVSNPFLIILSDFKWDDFFSWKIINKKIFDNIFSAQIEGIDIWNKDIFLSAEKYKNAVIKKQSLIILDKSFLD